MCANVENVATQRLLIMADYEGKGHSGDYEGKGH
jgi:hypothetical protein